MPKCTSHRCIWSLIPLILVGGICFVSACRQGSTARISDPAASLAAYRAELNDFRSAFGGSVELPSVSFFLFGMGDRRKLLYQEGKLVDVFSEEVVHQWEYEKETILPNEYVVVLETPSGRIVIWEDENSVQIHSPGEIISVDGTNAPINLPRFESTSYPSVLRVLHQEVLINIVGGLPVPNLFVYPKPWYRDAALMAMVLQKTENLHLVSDWIAGLSEPYDSNNAGESEADNLGEALYLISLVSDQNHPLVSTIQDELQRFEMTSGDGLYISGRSDFAEHPVYQTKWVKFGLHALELDDPYTIPHIADSYSSLFWMDYREVHVEGAEARNRDKYPYLTWATDHFLGETSGPISNRDYPLTWEKEASQADYPQLARLDTSFVRLRLSAPHTWHAAEIFLYLMEN